jgi:hypothetical protein
MNKIIFEDDKLNKEYLNIPDDVFKAMYSLMECFCTTREEIEVKENETGNSNKAKDNR